MKPWNSFQSDMLDFDSDAAIDDVLWRVCKPTGAKAVNGDVVFSLPFQAQLPRSVCRENPKIKRKTYSLRVRAYSSDVVRLTIAFDGKLPEDGVSAMLQFHPSVKREKLTLETVDNGWIVRDSRNRQRMRVNTAEPVIKKWSELESAPRETFDAAIFPDGKTEVPLMAYDKFFNGRIDSVPMGFVKRKGRTGKSLFSFYAGHDECFAGTGERFARMNLSGQTLALENTDAQGVNNKRAYKNVPFYVSSKPYGLFVHSSAHMRLSLAGLSTRAAHGVVEEPVLDLFVIGGGSVQDVVRNYLCMTGFAHDVPTWSYGTWMSRMTYFSAEEVRSIGQTLRDGDFPCDVLHIDTGWFAKDWVCEWEFSPERFANPEAFMQEMNAKGFRITLWQLPYIGANSKLFKPARENKYIVLNRKQKNPQYDCPAPVFPGVIDVTNPKAVKWYQGLLANLLKTGASAIKTDFGEDIAMHATYHGMPASMLHNLYAVLYQRAGWEITKKVTGEGIIWARAGWAGSQRYPVHWGGDSACTWDGLAGTIRGGLHIGLSGFAFWSHDIPGFHGVPDFMNSRPSDNLYVRWTQVGVFTSHMRYHGTSPREPYEYPAVADIARQWLKLRYALIPYIAEQGGKATETGLPVFRAMVFHHGDDPTCWHIDDQYYFGDDFLVAPVLNDAGNRDIYLPEGSWVDFWTGKISAGGKWLKNAHYPLERMPLFVRKGAGIKVYPEPVQCTDEMDLSKAVELVFDESYKGISGTVVGDVTGF